MIRGTTPTHSFVLPFGQEMIKTIEITYEQKFKTILKKKNDGVEFDGNLASVKLTQKETFMFEDGPAVKIQIRVLTPRGDVVASNPMFASVEECLSEEVLE